MLTAAVNVNTVRSVAASFSAASHRDGDVELRSVEQTTPDLLEVGVSSWCGHQKVEHDFGEPVRLVKVGKVPGARKELETTSRTSAMGTGGVLGGDAQILA